MKGPGREERERGLSARRDFGFRDNSFTSGFDFIRNNTTNEMRMCGLQCLHELIKLFLLEFSRYGTGEDSI